MQPIRGESRFAGKHDGISVDDDNVFASLRKRRFSSTRKAGGKPVAGSESRRSCPWPK